MSAIACRRPNHERISCVAASGRFGKYSRLANSTMFGSSTNCCHGWCIGVIWNWLPQRSNPVRSVVGEQRSQPRQEHYDRTETAGACGSASSSSPSSGLDASHVIHLWFDVPRVASSGGQCSCPERADEQQVAAVPAAISPRIRPLQAPRQNLHLLAPLDHSKGAVLAALRASKGVGDADHLYHNRGR
jgi:hypothetical protein